MPVINKSKYKSFRLSSKFFIYCSVVLVFLAFSFAYWILFPIALSLLILCTSVVITDGILLFKVKNGIEAKRVLPKMLGLADSYEIELQFSNNYPFTVEAIVYDELPQAFQERDFKIPIHLKQNEVKSYAYSIRPTRRGIYEWGVSNVICTSPLGLVERHYQLNSKEQLACYPSIIQMKNFELKAFAKIANFEGIKKTRRLGHSYEFEQIKQYIQGDDLRSVNWKATSRRNSLMVNQYEDERSQQIFCVIDKSRSMHMPFNGLSLLDYSINSSLVISNIALKKYDKAGLISFSDKLGVFLKAEKSRYQLKNILHSLYKENHRETEANFELLYHSIKKMVGTRSMLFLFSNFESSYALERALPVLRRINNIHLLVVIIFKNKELDDFAHQEALAVKDIYTQTIANKMGIEKRNMASILQKYGIQTILTEPEELSLRTVNKYLEMKAKGLI